MLWTLASTPARAGHEGRASRASPCWRPSFVKKSDMPLAVGQVKIQRTAVGQFIRGERGASKCLPARSTPSRYLSPNKANSKLFEFGFEAVFLGRSKSRVSDFIFLFMLRVRSFWPKRVGWRASCSLLYLVELGIFARPPPYSPGSLRKERY